MTARVTILGAAEPSPWKKRTGIRTSKEVDNKAIKDIVIYKKSATEMIGRRPTASKNGPTNMFQVPSLK